MTPTNPSPTISPKWEEIIADLRVGKRLVVVIGSGISAGVGAPTMGQIHKYLHSKAKALPASPTKGVILELLVLLAKEPATPTPRSIQVRLYHILQTNRDSNIRALWNQFGIDLMSGVLTGGSPMWELSTSRAHRWAGHLASQGRAILISLNYDGLTKKALEETLNTQPGGLNQRKLARIISSPDEIRQFFSNEEETVRDEAQNLARPTPVPIIKFRGDVFHAVCENGRCPERNKQIPIYALLEATKSTSSPSSASAQEIATTIAAAHLRCSCCGCMRHLQISFPGVFGKEQAIDKALAAFHETLGSRIAGVLFLGFSGTWDEALVTYLASRCAALQAPFISASKDPTNAIEQAAKAAAIPYTYLIYSSGANGEEEVLPRLSDAIPSATPQSSPLDGDILFPLASCSLADKDAREVSVTLSVGGEKQTITVVNREAVDSFTGVGGTAIHTDNFVRLQSCSQLGLKSAFLQEKEEERHNRYTHSVSSRF